VSTELALEEEMDLLQGRLRGGDKDGDDDVCRACLYIRVHILYIHAYIYINIYICICN
jgi:hypothetical protein